MRKLKTQPPLPSQPPKARDAFQKPMSNEQKIESIKHHVNQMYQIFGDLNCRLIALSRAKLGAKELAVFMRDGAANDSYMKNLNVQLGKVAAEETKNDQRGPGSNELDGFTGQSGKAAV